MNHKYFNRMNLLLLVLIFIAMLGISYGAYTGALFVTTSLSSGSMDFQFSEEDDDFSLEIQNGEKGKTKELKANATYDGKTLIITDMDPVDMSLLEKGNLRFIIRYAITAYDWSSIMKAAMKEPKKGQPDYEYVTFQRTTTTPQIIIKGDGGDLESPIATGVASQIIYDFLPDSLGDFYVTNNLIVDEDKETMQGIIVLEQKEAIDWFSENYVNLSSLDIPADELASLEKQDNLILSIQGCYGFEIPLVLDQFNVEQVL